MERESRKLFNETILKAAAYKFGIDANELSFVGGFQNYIYEFKKKETPCILRITHSTHRTENRIKGELDWIEYLSENGVCVSKPVCSLNGELTERIDTHDSYFTASAFEKAKGKKLSYPEYLGNEEVFFELGKITGRIHMLSKGYVPKVEGIRRHDWTENYYISNINRFVPREEYSIHKSCEELLKELSKLHKDMNSYGLIHGDINIGNFFADGNRITVFDFDECQYSWFIEDIAIQLYYTVYVILDDTIEERKAMAKRFMNRFMEGYNLENSIDDCWIKIIPLFLRLREIIVHVGIYRSWNFNNLNQWQKDYLEQSRARIEKGILLISEVI